MPLDIINYYTLLKYNVKVKYNIQDNIYYKRNKNILYRIIEYHNDMYYNEKCSM